MDALWWEPISEGRVRCTLCPRECKIGPGQSGFCFIRVNRGGSLRSLAYGHAVAIQIDPIEKKPLHHFYPGINILSLGTAGCNLGCRYCQNWDISRAQLDLESSRDLLPEEVCDHCVHYGCPAVAFTFNEPTVWGEYVIDISRSAHGRGLKTVMVSNGYISARAFHDVYRHIDAANIDLKAFTEEYYARITLSHLSPVLDTLVRIKSETEIWLEITVLLVPWLNDGTEEIKALSDWIYEFLGSDVPVHFTAFHPDFKLRDRPRTPVEILERARGIARERGIKYVYLGNVLSEHAGTRCPSCGILLIRRDWHRAELEEVTFDGHCPCGEAIAGRFDYSDLIPFRLEGIP